MHPLIRQQLGTERNKEMIAAAEARRRARQARRIDRGPRPGEGGRVRAPWRIRLPRPGQLRGA